MSLQGISKHKAIACVEKNTTHFSDCSGPAQHSALLRATLNLGISAEAVCDVGHNGVYEATFWYREKILRSLFLAHLFTFVWVMCVL